MGETAKHVHSPLCGTILLVDLFLIQNRRALSLQYVAFFFFFCIYFSFLYDRFQEVAAVLLQLIPSRLVIS